MNRKKILLIFAVITIIVIFIFISIINLLRQSKTTSQNKLEVTPSTPDFRSRINTITPPQREKKLFTLLSINPPENTGVKFLPVTQIEFNFSDTINPKTFFYEVSPSVNTYVKTRGSTLTLYPSTTWQEGITSIIILVKTTSASGARLDKSVNYKISTGLPPVQEGEFEGE